MFEACVSELKTLRDAARSGHIPPHRDVELVQRRVMRGLASDPNRPKWIALPNGEDDELHAWARMAFTLQRLFPHRIDAIRHIAAESRHRPKGITPLHIARQEDIPAVIVQAVQIVDVLIEVLKKGELIIDPASLANKSRAARDLAANLHLALNEFDRLRAVDAAEPDDPRPCFTNITSPTDQALILQQWNKDRDIWWASLERTCREVEELLGHLLEKWEALSKALPSGQHERLVAAARESLRNMRGMLAPQQPPLSLRHFVIPVDRHLAEALPPTWTPEDASSAEKSLHLKASEAAARAALSKGQVRAKSLKDVRETRAKIQRLIDERERRNQVNAAQARLRGAVAPDQLETLKACRRFWSEQIQRWRLCEDEVYQLLECLCLAPVSNDVRLHSLRTSVLTSGTGPRGQFLVRELCDLAGVSNSTLRKYAKEVGVETPGQGQRDHKYNISEAWRILEHMATQGRSATLKQSAKAALTDIERKFEIGK